MVRQSLTDPRAGLRQILALNLPRPILWQALLLVVLLRGFLEYFGAVVAFASGPPADLQEAEQMLFDVLERVLDQPMFLITMWGTWNVFGVFGLAWIGQMFGGQGRFDGALATIVWLGFVMLLVKAALTLLALALPFLGSLLLVVTTVIFFSVLTRFVAELHGFTEPLAVFFGIILAMGVLIIPYSFLFSLVFASFIGLPADV